MLDASFLRNESGSCPSFADQPTVFCFPDALCKIHFRVANLLHKHGAVADVQGLCMRTSLHKPSGVGTGWYHAVATQYSIATQT